MFSLKALSRAREFRRSQVAKAFSFVYLWSKARLRSGIDSFSIILKIAVYSCCVPRRHDLESFHSSIHKRVYVCLPHVHFSINSTLSARGLFIEHSGQTGRGLFILELF